MNQPTLVRLSAALVAVLSVAPMTAHAGEIIGLVEHGNARVSDAVVSLVDVSGNFRPSGKVDMDQKNKEFLPHILPVLKGTTVRFVSKDPFFHNVFSSSRMKAFNLSQEKAGDFSEVTFDKVGIVPIRCHIHANMKAYIVVCPNPYFGVSNGQGQFRISNVPAGTYQIKVWSETGTETQTVVVPASGPGKVIFKI